MPVSHEMPSTILAVVDKPAGGAAFSQVLIASGLALILTAALAGLGYGHRTGRLRLLTRAVFVIDANDKVTYVEYVPEVTTHPNYEAAIAAAKAAL